MKKAIVDVIILQETKREEIDRRVIRSLWRGQFIDSVYLPSSGKVGGITVAWDTRVIKVKEPFLGEFSVSIKISESREPRLVAIWGL